MSYVFLLRPYVMLQNTKVVFSNISEYIPVYNDPLVFSFSLQLAIFTALDSTAKGHSATLINHCQRDVFKARRMRV